MPLLEFNIIDIIGVTYAFSATRAARPPPNAAEEGGHVCVEKRRHLCYNQARLPRNLTALCFVSPYTHERRGSHPPHTPIARTASMV
jgi:hypothetical protein